MGIKTFFKNAFKDMKASAKAQHEVDKAEFQAAKAEAKANFEENRGRNTFAKAKADAKKNWDDAHMSPSESIFPPYILILKGIRNSCSESLKRITYYLF